MQRRDLLKLSTLLGTAGLLPWLSRSSRAQSDSYEGPYWLFVTASGGWDPRFLFDPTLNIEQNRVYTEIGQAGNISYATIDATPDEFGLTLLDTDPRPYLNPERFAQRFGARMTVFNGVDTATNNHDSGQRAFTSGTTQEGLPALGALLAGTYGLSQPLPFISFGGYDKTFDVAPLSRIGSSNLLQALAAPNVINPTQENSETYHTPDTYTRIRAAQTENLEALMTAQRLPRIASAERALLDARGTDRALQALQQPVLTDLPGNLNSAEGLLRDGQLALSAFQAGLGIAANLQMGGFDTHGNHDAAQRLNLIQLLTGVGALLDAIDVAGMTDKIYVIVGSDFGRTPRYNGDNAGSGKDHWSITSTLAIGPGIEGNRVIGATTDEQNAMLIDPVSLQAGGSTKLTPAEIQGALRRLAGIDPALATAYPLLASLPLFG